MASTPPILDGRTLRDILTQLQAQAHADLPEWTPPQGGDDAGTMLQRIFARLLEIALDRLNRVPEKHLLAFLDAMGVGLLPALPAEAPVTFALLKNAPPTLVPKGTQVGTKPGGQAAPVLFETIEELTVIPAQLTAAFTMDPVWDRYADQTAGTAGLGAAAFTPFVGTERMPHVLSVGDDALLDFDRPVKAVLWFTWQSGHGAADLREFLAGLTYQYRARGALTTAAAGAIVIGEGTARVEIPLADSVDSTAVRGLGLAQLAQNRWLQAVLTAPLPDAQVAHDLQIEGVTLSVAGTNIQPDLAYAGNAPLDLTRDCYPFGQVPARGSTLYLASRDAFAKPNSTVTLRANVKPLDHPVLVWEYLEGTTWSRLPSPRVADGTNGFTQSGRISLLVPAVPPDGAPAGGVAAWSNVWVRARLIGGAYRGAPSFTKFTVVSTAKLTAPAGPASTSIQIDVPDFAGPGQVLQVDGDYSVVAGVTNHTTLTLSPPLPNSHAAGAAVTLQLTRPAATLTQDAAKGLAQLNAAVTVQLPQNAVLLIDDDPVPEFVTVGSQQDPGPPRQMTVTPALANAHGSGASLAIVEPMDVEAIAGNTWVDQSSEVFPLGQTPGPSDVFMLYTFAGSFLWVISHAVGGGGQQLMARAPMFAAGGAGGGVRAMTGIASIQNLGNLLGGIGLFTNPFLNSPQMRITVDVEVKANLPPVVIEWESLTAAGWQALSVADGTDKFRTEGEHTVVLSPGACVPGQVNGQTGYWVRARIISGDYGVPLDYTPVDPNDASKGYQIRPGTGNLHPPILSSLSLDYQAGRVPTGLLTQNGFLYADQSGANPQGFRPFVAVEELTPLRHADPDPAFYLGFDQAFPEEPVRLYVEAAPRAFSGAVIREASAAPSLFAPLPALRWEYFNGTAWSALTVLDETADLTESGAVEFVTPVNMQAVARFDATPRYWIRARSALNDPFNTQQLNGVFLNTVTAVQGAGVAGEIVGSGSGQAGQTLRLSRTPVLPGQQVWVREPEQPPADEADALRGEEGPDAVQVRTGAATQPSEVWVRWHEVESFFASGPTGRHYTLDHASGAIAFGDGRRGLIPPVGTQNITVTYRSGGGAAGNVARGLIAQVKSAVPGIGGATNPVAADVGADAETRPLLEERGPQALRHRGRAVAAADIEWLARQAAGTRVARAKCLSNVNRDLMFEPGWVTLLIVPRSAAAKPAPGSQLVRDVERSVTSCAFAGLALTPARLNVIGAGYIQVVVAAEVVPATMDDALAVKQRVLDAVAGYLHPLTGGPRGGGWEFGQSAYISKIHQLIETVSGVDHVRAARLIPNLAQHRLVLDAPGYDPAVFALRNGIRTADGRKSALLARHADAGPGRLCVKGFKEGDRVTKVTDVAVASGDGTSVAVTPFMADAAGAPRGSMVMTSDARQVTRLAQGILPHETVTSILLETALAAGSGDVLTIFYPFPMTVSSVTLESLTLTVTGLNGPSITVTPFTTDVDLPAGTLVTTLDGTRWSPLAVPVSASQPGGTTVAVRDVAFAASLSLGDSILLLHPAQRLGVEPYEPESPFAAGSVIATLDNRVRLPLLEDVGAGGAVTALRLSGFVSGDRVVPAAADPGGPAAATVQSVEPVADAVDLDDNFLVYSGAHQILMGEA